MYRIELTPNDIEIIKTAVVSAQRLIASRESEKEAIKFTTACAEVVTRLNEARMDTTDVKFLCGCLAKFHLGVPLSERALRDAVRARCFEIQQKLVGVGNDRSVLPSVTAEKTEVRPDVPAAKH